MSTLLRMVENNYNISLQFSVTVVYYNVSHQLITFEVPFQNTYLQSFQIH